MQNIQKHPMVTASEAASALGIDSRTVREKLSNGEWKGEKRKIGLQEKWFMYRGELDRQLAKLQVGSRERVSTKGIDGIFDADPASRDITEGEIVDASPIDVHANKTDSVSIDSVIAKVAEQFAEQFSKQLAADKEAIFTLKRELEDKERQLRLLPDLQKQAVERAQELELKHVENEALKKQVVALQQQLEAVQKPWWKKMFAAPATHSGGAE